jgi:spore coat protein U-like protein
MKTLRGGVVAAVAAMSLTAAHAGCTLSSPGVAFGAYQPLTFPGKRVSADRTATTTVSLVCTGIVTGGSYSIALGPSLAGSSFHPRYLSNPAGGPNMAFNLYHDLNHTIVWGDGATGSMLGGSIPTGNSSQSHPVYGKVPAGQSTVKAGTFSGTLTMTLTYNP